MEERRLQRCQEVWDRHLLACPPTEAVMEGRRHMASVSEIAGNLARKRGENEEFARLAGFYHDLAAVETGIRKEHAHAGASRARGILGGLYWESGKPLFSEEELQDICGAIYFHTDKDRVHFPLAEVLKDADLIFADPDNGISYRKTAKTKDSEKFILPKEVVDYYESGRNVVFYCHKGRRKQEDWEQAKVQIRDYIRDAQILAVTFHRGTQRSYIFVLHPDCCLEYERILTAFLDSVWGEVFTWEDVDGNVLPAEYSSENENKIQLESLDCRFSVCKVTDYFGIDLSQPFCFTGTTDGENSLVCPETLVPDNTTDRDDGWRGFRIIGQLDFSLIGILARISKVLASNGIGIFAISTYNTDYILTKEENFEKSLRVLKDAGYEIK